MLLRGKIGGVHEVCRPGQSLKMGIIITYRTHRERWLTAFAADRQHDILALSRTSAITMLYPLGDVIWPLTTRSWMSSIARQRRNSALYQKIILRVPPPRHESIMTENTEMLRTRRIMNNADFSRTTLPLAVGVRRTSLSLKDSTLLTLS